MTRDLCVFDKLTLLNTLGSSVPGHERIISVEEVYELQLAHPDWVPMQTRQAGLEGTGEISLRRLVKEALRMRPSRVIVGEVRAAECLDLLLALNSGLPGSSASCGESPNPAHRPVIGTRVLRSWAPAVGSSRA